MKKHFLIMILLLALAVNESPGQYLTNWQYQEKNTAWVGNYNHHFYQSPPRAYVLSLDWNTPVNAQDFAAIEQKIQLPAGQQYTFELSVGLYYPDSLTGQFMFQIWVDSTPVALQDVGQMHRSQHALEWQKLSYDLTTPLKTLTTVRISLRLLALSEITDTAIKLFFDDIVLKIDGQPNPAFKNGDFSENGLLIEPREWENAVQLNWNFLTQKMMNPQGGVWVNYLNTHPVATSGNHYVQTEALGLQLWLAALKGDESTYNLIQNYIQNLFSPFETLYWQMDSTNTPVLAEDSTYSNSPPDDFRIINALLEHYDLHGDTTALNLARRLGNGLLRHVVVDHLMIYSFSWREDTGLTYQITDRFPVSYADLYVMARLAQDNPGWTPVIHACSQLTNLAQRENGLIYGAFDTQQLYFYGDFEYEEAGDSVKHRLKSIQTLAAAIGLARSSQPEPARKVYDFFKNYYISQQTLTDSSYLAEYYTYTGAPIAGKRGDERSYALLARLAHLLGDLPFGQEVLLNDILSHQVLQVNSGFYGAFGVAADVDGVVDTEAFNNQEPLLTLMQYLLGGFTRSYVQVPPLTMPAATASPNQKIELVTYPNPFNAVTHLKFELPHACHVMLKLVNVLGQEIVTLINQELAAGTHLVRFDGLNLPSGNYWAVLQTGDARVSRKLMAIK